MLLMYSSLFKQLSKWCLITAITQFIIFLVIFLGVSYLSTLIRINDSDEFITSYQKYIVLSSSLYMVVPFAFSNIFLFGLLHKHRLILKVYVIGSVVNFAVILIIVIGSGIFLALKGTDYIAYTLIVFGFLLESHGILLAIGLRNSVLENTETTNNRNSESSTEES